MREQFAMTMPSMLKKQMKRLPLPEGVKWSDVFQVMLTVAVMDKKGSTDEKIKAEVLKHKHGVVIREWIKETYTDFLEDD